MENKIETVVVILRSEGYDAYVDEARYAMPGVKYMMENERLTIIDAQSERSYFSIKAKTSEANAKRFFEKWQNHYDISIIKDGRTIYRSWE